MYRRWIDLIAAPINLSHFCNELHFYVRTLIFVWEIYTYFFFQDSQSASPNPRKKKRGQDPPSILDLFEEKKKRKPRGKYITVSLRPDDDGNIPTISKPRKKQQHHKGPLSTSGQFWTLIVMTHFTIWNCSNQLCKMLYWFFCLLLSFISFYLPDEKHHTSYIILHNTVKLHW